MQGATEEDLQSDAPKKANRQWRISVGQRWLTAIIAIPVVLVLIWFGGWAAFAAALLIVLLGTFELQNMMLHAGHHPLSVVSIGLSVFFLVAAMFQTQRLLLLEIGLGAAVLVSLPWLFFRKKLGRAGGLGANPGFCYLPGLADEFFSLVTWISARQHPWIRRRLGVSTARSLVGTHRSHWRLGI